MSNFQSASNINRCVSDWKIFFFNIKPSMMKYPSFGVCVFTGTRVGTRYEIMLLMTGSSGLCFRKAAYQQFVAEGERICSQW